MIFKIKEWILKKKKCWIDGNLKNASCLIKKRWWNLKKKSLDLSQLRFIEIIS